jgi:hypothetical protein
VTTPPDDLAVDTQELAYELARAIIADLAPHEQTLLEASIVADRHARSADAESPPDHSAKGNCDCYPQCAKARPKE